MIRSTSRLLNTTQSREFLPLSCFGERDLLNLKRPDSNISYGDFVDGCSGSEAEAGKRGQPLKIILRGRNPKADSVLDLLVRSFAFLNLLS